MVLSSMTKLISGPICASGYYIGFYGALEDADSNFTRVVPVAIGCSVFSDLYFG